MDSFTNTFIFDSNTCLVLQMSFHERKEERTDRNLKKVEAKPRTESAAPEMSKKFEDKIQKIEENICQWIDDEAKSLKDHLEKDICSIRNEVDNKNIEMNSKVQSITSLYIELHYITRRSRAVFTRSGRSLTLEGLLRLINMRRLYDI